MARITNTGTLLAIGTVRIQCCKPSRASACAVSTISVTSASLGLDAAIAVA
jgi:hypothetical protein